MSQKLYSVVQVAERLGLHVKTVRHYVRDGRLKAVRIGKQYRIARDDLEAFTGQPIPLSLRDSTPRRRHVEVSSVVQIDVISPQAASRLSTAVLAAAGGRRDDDEPLRIDANYDDERARLKLIVSGGSSATRHLLKLVEVYLNDDGP